MLILLGGILVVSIGLVIWGLMPSGGTAPRPRPPKKPAFTPAAKEPVAYPKESKVARLSEQVSAQQAELEKARAELFTAQTQVAALKKSEAALQENLLKRDEWLVKSEENVKKFKDESADAQKKFLKNEQQLQEGFHKNVELTRQLRELTQKH